MAERPNETDSIGPQAPALPDEVVYTVLGRASNLVKVIYLIDDPYAVRTVWQAVKVDLADQTLINIAVGSRVTQLLTFVDASEDQVQVEYVLLGAGDMFDVDGVLYPATRTRAALDGLIRDGRISPLDAEGVEHMRRRRGWRQTTSQ